MKKTKTQFFEKRKVITEMWKHFKKRCSNASIV